MIMYTDGGARGNPGPSAIGIVIKNDDGETIMEIGKFLGTATNNEAEYLALVEGLAAAKEKGSGALVCYLDSELVVKQLRGEYKVKNNRLKIFYDKVKMAEKDFTAIEYRHVPREKNQQADALVNEVLDSLS
jgi:ribonuclease HI